MNYLIKLIKSLLPIILIYIINFILIFIFSVIYTILNGTDLELFVNNYLPYLLIAFYIIIILIIKRKYPIPSNPTTIYKDYYCLYLGISLSTTLNMLIFLITKSYTKVTTSLLTSIISSAIVGPIFEEYIFRYYLLNKLKEFNKPTTAIILNSLIFAILHQTLINMFFALILGLILNITYHNSQNIKSSILVHIGSNLIAIFLTAYHPLILILSLVNLLLCFLIFVKRNKKRRIIKRKY
jgi:membrane protease YdiL (CAAX protease family)